MDVWVVKYASRRSRVGVFSGDSSVRGARIRGVLASQASAGQRGLSAQGVEPDGRGIGAGRHPSVLLVSWDQAIGSRSNERAGDRGGARADKPRWVSNRVRWPSRGRRGARPSGSAALAKRAPESPILLLLREWDNSVSPGTLGKRPSFQSRLACSNLAFELDTKFHRCVALHPPGRRPGG